MERVTLWLTLTACAVAPAKASADSIWQRHNFYSSSFYVAVNPWAPGHGLSLDAGTVEEVPHQLRTQIVSFLSDMGNREVLTDSPARVVINERTGTVAASGYVKIATIAIAHGNLDLVTREAPQVSQPNAFGEGRTVVGGMQQQQNLLQATLYSTSPILSLSLLDFIR